MPTGLSSNPDNIKAKDRQMLVGPSPDGDGVTSTPTSPSTDTDTLGDLTPVKGTIAVGDGSNWNVLAVGPQGYILYADPTQTVGLIWGDPTTAPVGLYQFDERDLWTYDWEAETYDDVVFNDVIPEYWLFEDL